MRMLRWMWAPVTVLGLIPWGIWRAWDGRPLAWGVPQWFGAWLLLNGLALGGWCAWLLTTAGQGTPFPLDPPRRLVAMGPYQYVRNPMVWAVWLILAGEALLLRSAALGAYAAFLVALSWCLVRRVEEPALRRRFGPAYDQYAQGVPRWLPRRRPWGPCGGGTSAPISGAPLT